MKTLFRYQMVGLAGVFVQLGMLSLLQSLFGLHYLAATVLAVETAVLHNYWWHWKWTWGARRAPLSSLARFQFTTGLVSILGNAAGVKLLVELTGLPSVAASAISIACLFFCNFLTADRFVFRKIETE